MLEEELGQGRNATQVTPGIPDEIYYIGIGSVPLTPVELSGLRAVERANFPVQVRKRPDIIDCKPPSESRVLLAKLRQSSSVENSVEQGPEETSITGQLDQETVSGLGSVGRQWSSRLLLCIPEERSVEFLEEAGFLEPVIDSLPEEANRAGFDLVYASHIEPGPFMPSYESFLYSR